MNLNQLRKTVWFLVVFCLISGFLSPNLKAETQEKHPLSHGDYDSWKTIQDEKISSDGKWIIYLETPQDGEVELVVKNPASGQEYRTAAGYSGEEIEAHRAAKPTFTKDSSHVIFLISPSKEESEKAQKEKKNKEKLKKKLGILNLADGSVVSLDEVKSFALPEKAGGWVAYLKEPAEKEVEKKEEAEKEKKEEKPEEEEKKEPKVERKYGTTLVLRSLADGSEEIYQDVLEYIFTKDGRKLLYVVSSQEKPETDGIYAASLPDKKTVPILTGKGRYVRWALDEENKKLAFLTDRDYQDMDNPVFNLYGCKLGSLKADLWVSHEKTEGFPDGMAVSDKSSPSFTKDGKIILLGIKEIPPSKNEEKEDEKKEAQFDLWHWNDPYPQPQQKKMADEVRDNTWESVYYIESGKFVRLADEKIPDVELSPYGKTAFAQTIIPYRKLVSYDGGYFDIYVIEPSSGERTLVKEKLYGRADLSPQGNYVYWFEDGDWHTYDISKKTTVNLTKDIEVSFERHDWDTPNPPRSYGLAGWTEKDKSILIYERFDIWEIKPDGSQARRITEGYGRENGLSFRYLKLDPEEEFISSKARLLLKSTHEETMAEGFFRDKVEGNQKPEKLLISDHRFFSVKKAEEAPALIYFRSAFHEYPDLWLSDRDFCRIKKLTGLSRQTEPFIWGKAELRDFKSLDGKPLKGILIKPDNFKAGEKYPLMVYIYETLHYMLHRFRHPSPGTSINPSFYVSNGYLIWMPDIEYNTGYPGKDALKCVLPGIQMLIREGIVDPEAVGIQGHSWGGYQIAYMVTQTDIFAAAEAGAPVSNMVSAYNGIRWGSGMVRQFQYERTQSRLGENLWNVPLRYIENSPLFWADKVKTPILMIHNDGDGAVPWYQGIEYIMALRRLGKTAFMFNYNGEDHGLRKRINQIDWAKRMFEFFNHYLKGESAPDWMLHGIKAWEKPKKRKSG